MSKVTKKIISATLICTFIVGGITCTSLAYQGVLDQKIDEEWTYIDDSYYSLVKVEKSAPILVKRLQKSDYDDIIEQLVDTSIEPDTAAARIAASDPDAVLPDNMLPDGRFLREDWQELYEGLISNASEIKTLNIREENSVTLENVTVRNKKISGSNSDLNDMSVKLISTDNGALALPNSLDNTSSTFSTIPNSKSVLYATENELVQIGSNGTSNIVSPEVYDGKTYEDLVAESIELYGENRAFWNGQTNVAPDGTHVAYVSNKADIQGTWDLFVLNLNTGVETRLCDDSTMDYFVEQWLDPEHILCMKVHDSGYEYVVVSQDGHEHELDFVTDNPVILGVRNGLIAYGNDANDIIYIGKYNNSPQLEEVAEFKLEGTFRIRPGIDPFSPDGKSFAYILVPENNYYGRDLVVVDLDSMTTKSNQTIPVGTKTTNSVLEFDWIDNTDLLTSVISNDSQTISSWIYHSK